MTSKNFFIFSEVLLGMLCLQPAVVLGTQPSHSGTTALPGDPGGFSALRSFYVCTGQSVVAIDL